MQKTCYLVAAAAVAVAGLTGATATLRTAAPVQGGVSTPAFSEKLPNVPGKTLTGVLVKYAPGAKSKPHHHAGSVMAYVLSGHVRSESSMTGPARIYAAGESFFEAPGSQHLVSENASETEPASLLAIFVADDGATLSTVNQ